MRKKITAVVLAFLFSLSSILASVPVHAAFNPNYIVGDSTFNNTTAISAAQIDAMLNARSSCISTNSGFSAIDPIGYNPTDGYLYGGNVSAGTVIAHAAQAYDLNPEVLVVTLQKEQSLITSTSCSTNTISKAVGYACPDGGSSYSYTGLNLYTRNGTNFTGVSGICVNSAPKAGFSQQLIRAAWLLKYSQQRSLGNTGWAIIRGNWNNSDDLSSCYSGAMTQGYRKRCASDSAPVYYDGYTTIDGTATFMGAGATASLYRYTPHFSGNTNFYNLFVAYFGDPNTACLGTANVTGAASGAQVIPYKLSAAATTSLAFTVMNNTGSTCAETHVMTSNYQDWAAHIATGMRANDPANGTYISMSPSRGAASNLVYLSYGGGGAMEVHKFSPDLQRFPGYYDVATNLSSVTATSGTFVSGDFLGRGYDQLIYVLYSGSGGHAEIHMFDPTLQRAIGYYDVATNLTGVSGTSGKFVAGDFLGRGYDQLAYVIYSGSGGHAEVHLFNQGLTSAIGNYDVPTDLSATSATNSTYVAGDFLGRGYDQLEYVAYSGTSTGRVETHMFNPALTRAIGYQDLPTVLSAFDPTQ